MLIVAQELFDRRCVLLRKKIGLRRARLIGGERPIALRNAELRDGIAQGAEKLTANQPFAMDRLEMALDRHETGNGRSRHHHQQNQYAAKRTGQIGSD